jgi:hypothetical protein
VSPSSGTGRGKPRTGLGDGVGARDGDGDERNMAQLPLRTDFFETRSLLRDGVGPRRSGQAATPDPTARESKKGFHTGSSSHPLTGGPSGSRFAAMSRGSACAEAFGHSDLCSARACRWRCLHRLDALPARGAVAHPASVMMRLARDARDAPRAWRSRPARWLETAWERGDEGDTGATRLPDFNASRR